MGDQLDTTTGAAGADANDGAAGAAAAGASGSGTPDQVSLLTSRLNGQTAKVGELTRQLGEKDSAITALQAQIDAFEKGKVGADEAAKAQVAAIQKVLDEERAARRTDGLKARFPETFAVFGDTASTFTEDVLAASEARLVKGGGAAESEEDEPPTPQTHNESRSASMGAGKAAKPETAADIRARLEATPWPEEWK